MAARDKKPKAGSGAPPPESEAESRPKSRLAAAPRAKTKANFKLNMIQAQNVRRRGRPAKRRPGRPGPGGPGRGKPPRDPPPDAKPSLARLVTRKRLVANAAVAKKKTLDAAKNTRRKPTADADANVEDPPPAVKKEPDPETSDSRPSSPKTRKPRTSSDLSIAMSSPTDPRSVGAKSPYSTRSERGNSPAPGRPPQRKTLRNGKRRSLKDALLNESVETEKRKRGRLASDSPDVKSEDVDEDRKTKRVRSFSREGSVLSKCSDAAESDASGFETADAKVEPEKETAGDVPFAEATAVEETIVPRDALETEERTVEPRQNGEDRPADAVPKSETEPADRKNAGDEAPISEVPNRSDGGVPDETEKIVEKSLILDNMSKTFNEISAVDSSKSIRRSARQRKITVKAKEHEEAILAETMDAKHAIKSSKSEAPDLGDKVAENADVEDCGAVNDHFAKTDIEQCKINKSVDSKIVNVKNNEKKTQNLELDKIKNETPSDRSDAETPDGEDGRVETPKTQNVTGERAEKLDDSSKENINMLYTQDIGKVIDRLKNFEEQDEKKRQEKMAKLNAEKRPVMVTNDVVLIPKSSLDKSLKDVPNAITLEKVREKETILGCFDINSSVSIVKKEQTRKSFDIDLPSGVTLIKRSGSVSRKHSTGSNSRDGDTVTMIDKSLGKEVPLDIRKSIDKGILSIEVAKPQIPTQAVLPKSQKISISSKESALGANAENCDGPHAVMSVESGCKERLVGTSVAAPVQNLTVISRNDVASPFAEKMEVEISEAGPTEKSETVTDREKSPSSSSRTFSFIESPEKQKQKEEILGTLGLLSLKAANQAKLDKQKQKELIKSNKSSLAKITTNHSYPPGSLKTVIKLNRNSPDKKKGRSPLKMTFHRNKSRTNRSSDGYSGDSYSDDEPTYTIHREFGSSSGSGTGSSDNHLTSGGHRKTHYSNRFNNHDVALQDNVGDQSVDANGKEVKNLVIPEKASSFGIHPDRLCQDQCSYCGGKFGLYDTPCHIAQMKSAERQKKILDNEEKLDMDSCLCDACYRHVDRRANCPSYKKRPSGITSESPVSNSIDKCYALSCDQTATHTLRRKWLVKMRNSISKVVQLDLDDPGLHTIPLCNSHYTDVLKLMVCGLCKRRLARNHVHYVNQEYVALNPILKEKGIPVVFHDKQVVCKLCRYYCTSLLRPSKPNQTSKNVFMKSHTKRIFKVYNLEVPEEYNTDNNDESSMVMDSSCNISEVSKEKKKGRNGKSKSKKGSDGKQSDENVDSEYFCEQVTSISKKGIENKPSQSNKAMVEDIESLISSNKILIPSTDCSKNNQIDSSGLSISEINNSNFSDYDNNPLIAAMDKQNETQSLSQKCNLPNMITLQKNAVSLTQKSRNILKVHNATSINKLPNAQRKLNRKIQKIGQIVTDKGELVEALNNKLPNREEFTIEPMCIQTTDDRCNRDVSGHSILRNIALSDECTIETIPPKPKNTVDINAMKNKWQMTESFSQVKRNLSALSKNLSSEQQKKKVLNQNDSQYSNPVKRLETNPSISVRELFPGEEEMNLHCSIEFGNVKSITPEGWEKCNSVIQYDSITKNLWQELQKPYGNQSSFLRHLILLEKYFRNGDLILSHNANCNAITYSESIQNRLRAFDNIPNNTSITSLPSRSVSVSQSDVFEPTRKSDNSSDFRVPILNISAGKSLLKSNQIVNNPDNCNIHKTSNNNKLDASHVYGQGKTVKNTLQNQVNDHATGVPKSLKGMPISLAQLEKLGNELTPIQVPVTPRPSTPRPDTSKSANDCSRISLPSTFGVEAKTSTPKSDSTVSKPKAPSLPPELIAINPQTVLQRKSIESSLKNIQQLTKGAQTTIQNTQATITPTIVNAQMKNSPKTTQSTQRDTNKKGKGVSKQWRPTLIPITDESKSRANSDVLHQTADGRKLPSLVQVMQGGKPYHITIQDYNRMCILRQKKIQMQMQKAELVKNQNQSPINNINNNGTDNITATFHKSTSPPIVKDIEKPPVAAQTNTTKSCVVQSNSHLAKNTVNKCDEIIDSLSSILPEMETTSLLKNVALKNVTIAPINSNSDSRTSANLTPPQSLLITSAKSVVQVPQIVTQLSPSVSVTAETIINSDSITAVIPKVVPTTSAITMPKIPKSLTVIPQTITSCGVSSIVPEVQASSPLTVLPLPPTTTVTSSIVSASPSEP